MLYEFRLRRRRAVWWFAYWRNIWYLQRKRLHARYVVVLVSYLLNVIHKFLLYVYCLGHHEFPPYTEQTKRSVYHVRNLEVFRLKQVQQTLFLNSVTFTLVDILFRFPAISTFSSLTTGLEVFTTLAMPTLCCDEKSISGRKLRMGRWAVLRLKSCCIT